MIVRQSTAGVCPLDVTDGVYYPSSDGKPLGETPRHVINNLTLYWILMKWFADVPDLCPSANIFVYYEEGNPRRHVSPDLMVVRGAPKHDEVDRRRYLMWLEGQARIEFVLEVTSESTRDEDRIEKRQLYQDVLRVREYFLYDPHSEYLDPPLQGFRLVNGVYQPIEFVESRLPSETLGLHLEHAGEWLRLYNPATDEWLKLPDEYADQVEEYAAQIKTYEAQVQTYEEKVQTYEEKVHTYEEKVHTYETQVQTYQGQVEHLARESAEARRQLSETAQRLLEAESERQQVEQEKERERQSRIAAEEEARRLREELERLRRQGNEQTGSSDV